MDWSIFDRLSGESIWWHVCFSRYTNNDEPAKSIPVGKYLPYLEILIKMI